MEIRTVGGQSSSGEKKEYFFALALDLIPGLQHAAGSWCQAYNQEPCYYTDNIVSVSSWFPATPGNLYSSSLTLLLFFSLIHQLSAFLKLAHSLH